jgi:phage shock protein PspC (stress-responsive transcriptional regulator)
MSSIQKCKLDKKIFGVCCGLSKSLGLDVSLVRLIFILGTIFSGSLLLWIYLLLAIILPSDNNS